MDKISYHEFREDTKKAEKRSLEGDAKKKRDTKINKLSSNNKLWKYLESAVMLPGNRQSLVQHFMNNKSRYDIIEVVEVWETLMDICEEEFY